MVLIEEGGFFHYSQNIGPQLTPFWKGFIYIIMLWWSVDIYITQKGFFTNGSKIFASLYALWPKMKLYVDILPNVHLLLSKRHTELDSIPLYSLSYVLGVQFLCIELCRFCGHFSVLWSSNITSYSFYTLLSLEIISSPKLHQTSERSNQRQRFVYIFIRCVWR